jgi:DeoR family transcriptional regulator, aga operon transcriptional repressor
MSLKTDDRANQILRVLLRHGSASIDDLIQELDTSAPNIRRDLAKLERRGLVCRTHGGAELFGPQIYEPFRFDAEFQTREERFVKEKRRIALAAADLIREHETIAFTAGTTTTQIARSIRHRSNLRIITNAVNIGMELCNQPGLKTSLTGGVVQWAGSFSLIGPAAIQSLGEINVDRAFIGVCGMDAKRGASTIEMDEAVVFRAMAHQARQVVVVADSSKIGMVSPGLICPSTEVQMVITDDGASPDVVADLQAKGVEVMTV